MKKVFALVLVILALVSAAPASAQKNIQPMPVAPTGIAGYVTTYNGGVPTEVTLVFTRVDHDYDTWMAFANQATAKRFGLCSTGQVKDCVFPDGRYLITDLPEPADEFNTWREIDVRAEAKGFVHYISHQVRVSTDGSMLVFAQPIMMYASGFETSKTYMWWVNERVVGVGVVARQDWEENVLVEFAFKGSSWQKAQMNYGTAFDLEKVGPDQKFVYRYFWAPQSYLGSYGGSFCGTVTIRSSQNAEDIRETLKEVCVGLRPQTFTKLQEK